MKSTPKHEYQKPDMQNVRYLDERGKKKQGKIRDKL